VKLVTLFSEYRRMPLTTLSKLPCGVIYTEAFVAWLEELYAVESTKHPRQVLTLDYVRCKSGAQQGNAWWQLLWTPEEVVPAHRTFKLNNLPVYLSKATQHGLRERCLDCEGGRVVVRP
jgi:hypothetical protein